MSHSPSFTLGQANVVEVLQGLPIPAAILDSKLQIIHLNRSLEAMIGYHTAEVYGIPCEFVLRSNFSHRHSPFSRVLATGESITVDGNILTLHHKKIPIRFTISPLGKPGSGGILAVLEDTSLEQEYIRDHLPYVGGVEILGHSPQMQEIFELIPILAQTDASVLITGETGTGKDMVAETIHRASKRAHNPFIKVNCGALPESLLESELFGHVRGAFTGATQDKPGMFRLADQGTIFLTEIGDLPLPLQIKLLSVLDDHDFFPVGGSKKIKVDVRIIAATHRSLRERVEAESFREDLFYRLNVLRLHLPALRDREGDIQLLLDHFLQKFDTKLNKGTRKFSPQSMRILNSYGYPGNVRELRNIVEYSANICHEQLIDGESLPRYLLSSGSPQLEQKLTPETQPQGLNAERAEENSRSWQEVEHQMIVEALKRCGGNRTQAAKMLGWGRTTLWRKLKNHKLT